MIKHWMALSSVSGVGPKTIRMLVSRFGSPDKVFSAPAIEIARLPRLNLPLAYRIIDAGKKLAEFERLIKRISDTGLRVLCPDSCEYPELLKLTGDFPPILYRRGAELPKGETTVAIVGARSPTPDGAKVAGDMAERLAGGGIVIVSGLARGVDAAAHKGALRAGGKTVGIPGSGLRVIYPHENRQLANEICVNGAVISECHPNETVSRQRLMQRNRIISGFSLGVILIEPGRGALNAAERALKQNRRVFIYKRKSGSIMSDSVLEKAIFIGRDELDMVADRLQIVENSGSQMRLL